MKSLTIGTTECILKTAMQEFLEYGYQNSNLRRISAKCNVSTHTIYTRFGDKEGLFNALVKPTAGNLFDLIEKMTESAKENHFKSARKKI